MAIVSYSLSPLSISSLSLSLPSLSAFTYPDLFFLSLLFCPCSPVIVPSFSCRLTLLAVHSFVISSLFRFCIRLRGCKFRQHCLLCSKCKKCCLLLERGVGETERGEGETERDREMSGRDRERQREEWERQRERSGSQDGQRLYCSLAS